MNINGNFDVEKTFTDQIFFDHIYRIVKTKSQQPLQQLQLQIKKWFGSMYKHLIKGLESIDHFDIPRAKRIIHNRINRFLQHFLNLNPVEFFFIYHVRGLFSDNFDTFKDSKLMNKIKIKRPDYSFLDKLVYFTGLLGGKASIRRKHFQNIFFKLRFNTSRSLI